MEHCEIKHINIDKVNRIKENLEPQDILGRMAVLYKLFGDMTRLRIISLIVDNELCVCEIEELLNLSQSLISHQLRKLKDANVVKTRRDGKKIYYSLADKHVVDIYQICLNHIKKC